MLMFYLTPNDRRKSSLTAKELRQKLTISFSVF